MLPAQLDSVDEGHLNALVTNGVLESRSLEFKAKLVWGTESERKEFLADVSAFANGGGGDLVLGIEEDNGAASKTWIATRSGISVSKRCAAWSWSPTSRGCAA